MLQLLARDGSIGAKLYKLQKNKEFFTKFFTRSAQKHQMFSEKPPKGDFVMLITNIICISPSLARRWIKR